MGMSDDVRVARRNAKLWVGAEDFVRWVYNRRPGQYMHRVGYAAFTVNDYMEFFCAGKSESTGSRSFERWKRDWGYTSGFIVRWENLDRCGYEAMESALAHSGMPRHFFYLVPVSGSFVKDSANAALSRRDELVSAYSKVRGKPPTRSQSVAEAADVLGVRKGLLYNWLSLYDMPSSKRGGRHAVCAEEIRRWATERDKEWLNSSALSHWHTDRVPVEIAQKSLLEVKSYLELTSKKLAGLLGVSTTLVDRILNCSVQGSKTVAVRLLSAAECLLDTYEIPAGGVPVQEAARRLVGIKSEMGVSWVQFAALLRVDVDVLLQWSSSSGRSSNDRSVCEELMASAEKAYDSWAAMETGPGGERVVTKEQLEAAMSCGCKLIASASLGLTSKEFRLLAKDYGVKLPVPASRTATGVSLRALSKRHDGVRWRMAAELSVSKTTLRRILKAKGVYSYGRRKPRESYRKLSKPIS